MADREAITQEFYNNEDHQDLFFRNVQSTEAFVTSGCGTYGRVEKVKVGLEIRAGKALHDKLIRKSLSNPHLIVTDFVQVCKRIVSIDHPNIIKVIGIALSSSVFPMFVMELMDNNLHHYLEMRREEIPLIIKQSILEDIARGLLYLHTQSPDPIVHRDLTAHNVLLSSSLVAKITDIGNATFSDLLSSQSSAAVDDPGGMKYPLDMMVYMPPEYGERGKISPSLDVFSFGHIVLFTAIQDFPHDLLPPDYCNPDYPDWVEGLSEVDRRRRYFERMDIILPLGSKNPLVKLAKDCLCSDPQTRPPTADILARMKQMVEEVGRIPGDKESLDRMEVIKLLVHQQDKIYNTFSQERDEFNSRVQTLETSIDDFQRDLKSMKAKAAKEKEEKDIQIAELETQMERLQEENSTYLLRFKDTLSKIAEKAETQKKSLAEVSETREEEETLRVKMEVEIDQLIGDAHPTIDPVTPSSPSKFPVSDLAWDQLPDLPVSFPKHPSAVYLHGYIYVGGGGGVGVSSKDHSYFIYIYNLSNGNGGSWSQLPRCPRRDFGMAAVNDTLVIVGGVDSAQRRSGRMTVWDSTAGEWREGLYPNLSKARSAPSIIIHEKWLFAIGGLVADKPVPIVEKLDIEFHKSWSLCSPLPEECTDISSTIINDTLYVAGSMANSIKPMKCIFSVSVGYLIETKPKDKSSWEQIPALIPSSSSSTVTSGISQKNLLAIGGEMSILSSMTNLSPVLGYDLRGGRDQAVGVKWKRVGSLPCERHHCTCLKVSENTVVVVGGSQVQSPEGLRRVDIGTFKRSEYSMSSL